MAVLITTVAAMSTAVAIIQMAVVFACMSVLGSNTLLKNSLPVGRRLANVPLGHFPSISRYIFTFSTPYIVAEGKSDQSSWVYCNGSWFFYCPYALL